MTNHGPGSGWRWILIAAAVGATASSVLTMVLRLDRHTFVAGWMAIVGVLWAAFAHHYGVHLRTQVARRQASGLVIGTIVGALLAWTVWRQPASAAPTSLMLLFDLAWLGAVYGAVDAIILAVLPVMALYASHAPDVTRSAAGRLRGAGAALVGSALITAAYHAGFREFHGPQLVLPVLGGLLTTVAYLLSGSIVAPILAHVIMHAAAVLHGATTTVQLPPHY